MILDTQSSPSANQNQKRATVSAENFYIPSKPDSWFTRGWNTIFNAKTTLLLSMGLFLVIGAVIAAATLRTQQITTKASSHQAKISIQPASVSVGPNAPLHLQLWATTDSPLVYMNVKITYDPAVIQLTKEVTLTSGLKKVIQKTTMVNANTNGKMKIVIGLDPASRQDPPAGTFQVASLQFAAVTTAPATTTVSVLKTAVQLVAADTTTFTVTAVDSTVTVNQSPTDVPPATPNQTNTPASTGVPPATPHPTDTPIPRTLIFSTTPTPTRSIMSNPTLTPTPTPEVTSSSQ